MSEAIQLYLGAAPTSKEDISKKRTDRTFLFNANTFDKVFDFFN